MVSLLVAWLLLGCSYCVLLQVTALEQEIAVLRRQMQTALDMVRPVEARIKTKGMRSRVCAAGCVLQDASCGGCRRFCVFSVGLDLGLHPVDELQDTLIGKSKKVCPTPKASGIGLLWSARIV